MKNNHSDSTEDAALFVDSITGLKNRWTRVQNLRIPLAEQLTRLANELSGQERRQIKCWSDWFRQETELEDALSRPDILAIAMPILDSDQVDEYSAEDLPRIADASLSLLNVNPSTGHRAFRILRYPMMVVFALGLLWLGFIVWLAPVIRQMVNDFGIDFPLVTQALLGMSPVLHNASWVLAAVTIVVILIGIYQMRMDRRRAPNTSWIDRRLTSTRCAVGAWTWHVALLMQAGLNAFDSAKMAGLASGNYWVKSESLAWAKTSKKHCQETSRELDGPSSSPTIGNTNIFTNSPYRLVNSTMQLPDSELKTTMLQQAAKYYLDRDRGVCDWWFRLLSSLILLNIGLACTLFFVALYGTTFSFIRGLTGLVW